MNVCGQPECSGKHEAKGLCRKHYVAAVRNGSIVPRQGRETVSEKFESRVSKSEGCWAWTGSTEPSGYGRLTHKVDGRYTQMYAHRVSYELHHGEIPEGMVIDHLCRNRACVNPEHLEAVTNEENIQRGEWAPVVLAKRAECNKGHEYTEENTYITGAGTRKCRECTRIYQRGAYARKRTK